MIPVMLTEKKEYIKMKFWLTFLFIILSPCIILMKALIYCKFSIGSGWEHILGIYENDWTSTFLQSILVFVLGLLMIWCYHYQLSQVNLREASKGTLKFQTRIKFHHKKFGDSQDTYYLICIMLFLTSTMLNPTVVPALFAVYLLVKLYIWSLNKSIDEKIRIYCLQTLQIISILLLSTEFIL